MTTSQQRKLFELTSENKQRTDGASGCGCDWILSSYRHWLSSEYLAGEFSSFILLFYYLLLHTNAYWDSCELYRQLIAEFSACNGIVFTKDTTV